MRAGTDEIQVADLVVAVVGAEIGALRQHRFQAERAAQMRGEIAREIRRRIMELGHDPLMNIGDQAAADFVQHALFKERPGLVPIDRQFAHMGNRHQRVEGGAALRRHRRIGDGGVVQIDREILRQHAVIVDVLQQPVIARAEQDHVVRNARPAAFDAEMHDEQRRRIFLLRQLLGRLLPARGLAQQILVAVHDVRIARHRIGIAMPAALGGHARRAVAHRLDMLDRIAQPHGAADPLEMRGHPGDQPVGAAHREPDAAVFLQLVDQRIDGAGGHGIAADEQRMEAQRLAQLLVLHELADHGIDRAPGLIFHQCRRGLDHAGEIEKRLVAQLHIAFLEHASAVFQELGIACHIVRVQLGDFRIQLGLVIRIIEIGAVHPVEAIEGEYRLQRHVARHVRAGERPEFLQAIGIGDHGGAGIEDETLTLPIIAPATGLVPRLDQRGLDTGGLQANGECQAAESCADHDRGLAGGGGAGLRAEQIGLARILGACPWSYRRRHTYLPKIARRARDMGMGGLPDNMRILSAAVLCPA